MAEEPKNKLILSAPDDSTDTVDKNKLPSLSDKDDEEIIDPKQAELESIVAETDELKNDVRDGKIAPNEAFQRKMELDERYRQLTSAEGSSTNKDVTVPIGVATYTNTQGLQNHPELQGNISTYRDTDRLEIPFGKKWLGSQFYVAASVDSHQSPESRAADIVAGKVRGTVVDGVRSGVEGMTGSNIAGAVAGLATGITAQAMTPTIGDENKLTGTTYGIQVGMRF